MGWFKIYYPLVLYVRYLLSEKKKKKPPPPATGKNATPQEKGKSKDMEEKRKEKEKQQKSEDGLKLVVTGAKIKCPLCTNPIGTLLVTDLNPTVQNKPVATVSDNKKTNLLFTGTCTKSPNSSVPCIAIIQPGQWQNTGSLKVQNKSPLLAKSSVKCMYGSTDIKFINSGQMKPPFSYDDKGPERKTKPEETINIRVSMFFDGTGNNKTNTESRFAYRGISYTTEDGKVPDANEIKNKAAIYEKNNLKKNHAVKDKTSSYENDFTNVARLYKDLKDTSDDKDKSCHVYVEGIGTTNDSTDATAGMAVGMGETGILEKVKEGCIKVANKIDTLSKGKTIVTLTIDVFGFSRGAAAARNFLHEITLSAVNAHTEYKSIDRHSYTVQVPATPAAGKLGSELQRLGVKYEELMVLFAGLFDTVPSYGLVKSWNSSTLHLDAVKKARSVLHLTALDERRANFPLVTAESKGASCEKALPGVHSDIGGSYNTMVNENNTTVFEGSYSDLEQEMKYLVDDGWYAHYHHKLTKHFSPTRTAVNNYLFTTRGYLEGDRKEISNAYCFIPLYIMRDFAKKKLVYLKFKGDLESECKIPGELDPINQRLRDYVFDNGKPMIFYDREKIDNMILIKKSLQIKNINYLQKSSTYVAPSGNAKIAAMYENAAQLQAIEDEKHIELNPDDFKDDPELQMIIWDHNSIRALRSRYLHISHNCSLTPTFTLGMVEYMDPFSRSSRAAKIRKQYPG